MINDDDDLGVEELFQEADRMVKLQITVYLLLLCVESTVRLFNNLDNIVQVRPATEHETPPRMVDSVFRHPNEILEQAPVKCGEKIFSVHGGQWIEADVYGDILFKKSAAQEVVDALSYRWAKAVDAIVAESDLVKIWEERHQLLKV